jgi:hypothetical protein
MQTQWIKTADSLTRSQDIRAVWIEAVRVNLPTVSPYFLLQTNRGAIYRTGDESLINFLRAQLERFLISGEDRVFDFGAVVEDFERGRRCVDKPRKPRKKRGGTAK